jgi:hypothetical protein
VPVSASEAAVPAARAPAARRKLRGQRGIWRYMTTAGEVVTHIHHYCFERSAPVAQLDRARDF